MSDVVSTHFRMLLPDENGELGPCIDYLEAGLRALKPTAYHRVLGRSFLSETTALGKGFIEFHQKASASGLELRALYVEMNGFTINPDQWHCDLFGYKQAGDILNLDWLSDWDAESASCFVLKGMEPVQEAFAEFFLNQDQPLGVRISEEIAEHLVTVRFMELVADAHKFAGQRYVPLRGLPVFATAHDWDIVHKTV